MPGPVVFITGAGRGLGRALALRFARDGYSVAASGRSEGPLGMLVREIVESGGTAAPFACDVTDRRSVVTAVSSSESTFGPIDVLVNNAGAAASAPFVSMNDELWDEMMSVNLTGTYLCMRAVLPGMFERRRGRVINIASTAGKTGFMYTSAYCAAKHAVVGLTRSVALEAAKRGVTVNAICPGWLNTDMTDDSIARIVARTGRTQDEARGMLEQMNPQGRLIEPEEVAALAAYLASADAAGINGQALNVDGGELLA
jgi:NAD(P)-dependent dehydrogenase (short-subunit alcohol dehydrogenase family)